MSEKLNFLKQPKHLKYVGKTPNTACPQSVFTYSVVFIKQAGGNIFFSKIKRNDDKEQNSVKKDM